MKARAFNSIFDMIAMTVLTVSALSILGGCSAGSGGGAGVSYLYLLSSQVQASERATYARRQPAVSVKPSTTDDVAASDGRSEDH